MWILQIWVLEQPKQILPLLVLIPNQQFPLEVTNMHNSIKPTRGVRTSDSRLDDGPIQKEVINILLSLIWTYKDLENSVYIYIIYNYWVGFNK